MTRRQFLETGARGIVIASIPGLFQFDPTAAFATPTGEVVDLKEFYRHFGVDEKTVLDVMQTALDRGGDYCDIYFQHQIANSVGLEDKSVNKTYTSVDFGVGIRVVSGDQTGYSFTEEISSKAMKLAAATASNIANQAKNSAPVKLELKTRGDYYPIETLWEEVRIDRKIPYLQTINNRVFSKDKRIIKSRIWFSDSSSYVLIANSNGQIVCDYRPMTSIRVSCTAERDGRRESNGFDLAARHGIEFFTGENVERLADESVMRTIDLFEAVKPEAGEMEVVLAAGSSGILLHEAIGHGMEADFNRKNISIFADKINKPVARDFVSIVDSGTNLNIRGSLNIDDEGNDTEETYLVQNGILTTYLHDRISAKHYKAKHTGSGRRESFRHAPMPRMRNTYMLPGPHTRDEIIKSVKKGLYAESFTNGQVFIGAGDFTFYVKSGNLIEDGKLTRPVKDINIIGNGPEVLANIVMVADDLKLAEGGWTCGKNGQSVPVSMGLPTVKVSSITVGGVS
jgi:TldD protein